MQMWIAAGEALVAASYAAAAYQDLRSREVEDLTWIPAGAGLVVLAALGTGGGYGLAALLAKVGLMAALGIAWRRMGLMASGDVPAVAFSAASACYMSPLPELIASLAAVLAISAAETGMRWRAVLGVEEAISDGRWIPRRILGEGGEVLRDLSDVGPEDALKALEGYRGSGDAGTKIRVEASYGVPMAAALGIGYIVASIAMAAALAC